MQGTERRAVVLLSDAECNEGATWEAAMFAAHHGLANLIAIVDANGQQALGYTDDVLRLSPLAERWRAFGWRTHEADGHDAPALAALLNSLDTRSGPPHVVIAQTIFGYPVSFMQRQIKWHYWPMSDEEYAQALREIGAAHR
jgi:transketolase